MNTPALNGVGVPWYYRYRTSLPAATRHPWRIRVHKCPTWFELDAKTVEAWKGVRLPPLIWPGEYRVLERWESLRVEVPMKDLVAAGGCPPDDSGCAYVTMREDWRTWMSDTAVEIATQAAGIRRLRGRVLIGGLGLGVMVKAALSRRDVTAVDVVELDPAIIDMVAPHYRDRRLRVIEGDALAFEPDGRWYDVVYMDIWRNIGACNLIDMMNLRRRWIDRCGWYGAWSEDRAIVQLGDGTSKLKAELAEWALHVLHRTGARCRDGDPSLYRETGAILDRRRTAK